jgi:hypothetical protein
MAVLATIIAALAGPVAVAAPAAASTAHYDALRGALSAGEPLGCADVLWAAGEGLVTAAEVRALEAAGLACPDTRFVAMLALAERGQLSCEDLEWHAARGLLDHGQAARLREPMPSCTLSTFAFLYTVLASRALGCADVEWHAVQGGISWVQAAQLRGALEPTGADCAGTLRLGAQGAAVEALQERLSGLGYWVGDEPGFGPLTRQAVYAFEKVEGRPVDGVVDVADQVALERATRPAPSSSHPDVVEVDKGRQLLLVVRGGTVQWVFNTSTGTEERYLHPEQGWQLADTPPGLHRVDWHVDGVSDGELGLLYRPKFFHHDGIAVHGYDHVPPRPASHGCVRVTDAAMDHIGQHDLMPLGSLVDVYGTAPTA